MENVAGTRRSPDAEETIGFSLKMENTDVKDDNEPVEQPNKIPLTMDNMAGGDFSGGASSSATEQASGIFLKNENIPISDLICDESSRITEQPVGIFLKIENKIDSDFPVGACSSTTQQPEEILQNIEKLEPGYDFYSFN